MLAGELNFRLRYSLWLYFMSDQVFSSGWKCCYVCRNQGGKLKYPSVVFQVASPMNIKNLLHYHW